MTTFWLIHNLLSFQWCEKSSIQLSEPSGLFNDGQTNIHKVNWNGPANVVSNDLFQANVEFLGFVLNVKTYTTTLTGNIYSWRFFRSQRRFCNNYLSAASRFFAHKTLQVLFSKRRAKQAKLNHNSSNFAPWSSLFITLFKREITFLMSSWMKLNLTLSLILNNPLSLLIYLYSIMYLKSP